MNSQVFFSGLVPCEGLKNTYTILWSSVPPMVK